MQLISFTFGQFRFKDDPSELIKLAIPGTIKGPAYVRALGIRPRLNYRMDAKISTGVPLGWPAKDVLLRHKWTRHARNIGLYGYINAAEPKYFPLRHSSKLLGNGTGPAILLLRSSTRLTNISWAIVSSPSEKVSKFQKLKTSYRAWEKIPIELPKELKGSYWIKVKAKEANSIPEDWQNLVLHIEL